MQRKNAESRRVFNALLCVTLRQTLITLRSCAFRFAWMQAVVVLPKTKAEFNLISALFSKMEIPTKAFSIEHLEDLGLSLMMNSANREKKVSRKSVMKKLR